MKNEKRQLVKDRAVLLVLSILLFFPMAVLAADVYPSKPIRLIVPFTPGGGVDIIGRVIVTKLSERLGKPIVMDYRGGAGGVIGADMVAKANPDGYTLLLISGTHTTSPALQKVPYDMIKSFVPIVKLVDTPVALVVNTGVPAKSLKDFIALAKQKPGQLLFVTSGVGGANHMQAAPLEIMANIKVTIVHFKGMGPAVIDLIGGHSHANIGAANVTLPHVKSGKLRMLCTSGLQRSVLLPDVPTFAEAGVPGFEASQWYGILAPAGTPAWIVEKLDKELRALLDSDETKKEYLKVESEVAYLGPIKFGQFIERELTKWARVAKESGIKME